MAVFRAFRSVPAPCDRSQQLGTLLQFLLSHGDDEWVEEVIKMAQHRAEWVIHRDSDDSAASPRK